MNDIKLFICKLIIVSILLQLSSSVFINERYKSTIKLVSSIIMINILFSFPLNNIISEFENITPDYTMVDNNNIMSIEDDFCQKVSLLIKNDIDKKYSLNSKTSVTTDYENLYISVIINKNIDTNDVAHYIKRKYCNSDDEVKVDFVKD